MLAGAGFLLAKGALDFAGGTVVHINAAIAGLVGAFMVGKRIGYGKESMAPHSLTMTMIGARCCGWAGSASTPAPTSKPPASPPWLGQHLSPPLPRRCPGCLRNGCSRASPRCWVPLPARLPVWWRSPRRAASSARWARIVIGLLAGVVCLWGVNGLKKMLGADDALDVFGVHGVGGILGAILTGVFAARPGRHRRV